MGTSYGSGFGGFGGYGGMPSPAVADPANPEGARPECTGILHLEPNLRNEYQGMVSGLGSILQLGYASISMVVFVKNFASIIKTSYTFMKSLVQRFGKFVLSLPVIRLLPKLLDKLRSESASMVASDNSLVSRLLLLFRVITAGCLFALFFMKKMMKEENDKDIEQFTV